MRKNVYIVDGNRTPFIKAMGKPNPLTAADLAVEAIKPLMARQPFSAENLGEVIAGCVGPAADEANIARIIALRIGCGVKVPAWTVQRNCASGLQALDAAYKDIITGRHDLVLAGGTEAMSRAPLLFNDNAVNWFADLAKAKSVTQKIKHLLKLRPKFFVPEIALLKGLADPVVNLSMGQTAEKVAHRFKISRQEMDEYAVQSHLRALEAQTREFFAGEISPLFDSHGQAIEADNGVRADSSVERLGKLKPVFDRPFGHVTAGNSSQLTDGAAFLLLAGEAAVEKYNLKPLARIVDFSWQGLDPTEMGLGPAYCIANLLTKHKLKANNIDYWEINEAFAAQVLGCVKALDSTEYSTQYFGLKSKVGGLPMDKINVDGGAIAVGHPVGASGARIALHLARTLERADAKKGIATLCIGGGQGGAILIDRV